jgi:hypothetical protein
VVGLAPRIQQSDFDHPHFIAHPPPSPAWTRPRRPSTA